MPRPCLSLLLALALAGCAAPTPATPVPAAARTPLETLVGYRLQAGTAASGLAVLGVAPPVSALTPSGDRFMVRPDTHEVLRLDAKGTLTAWGGLGGDAGRFNRPESLSASGEAVYVADTQNHRVQIFGLDGRPLGQWGGLGTRPGQLMSPRAVEVLKGGCVAVTDDFRVQYFRADGTYMSEVPINLGAATSPSGVKEAEAQVEGADAQLAAQRQEMLDAMTKMIVAIRSTLQSIQDAQREKVLELMRAGLKASAERLALQPSGKLAAAVFAASVQQLLDDELQPPSRTIASLLVTDTAMVQPLGGLSQSGSVERVSGSPITAGSDYDSLMMQLALERVAMRDQELARLMAQGGSSSDMARLQDLIAKRDQAFEQMTQFMKTTQDTRSSVIGNLR